MKINEVNIMKTIKRLIRKAIVSVLTAAVLAGGGIGLTAKNALAYNAGIEAFVNSLYSDCLGRSADPTGFNDWCNKLATGQITGKQAAYGFFFSPEFQAKANAWSDTELINAYYKVFLNRTADPTGAAYWAQQIAGTTNDISILFTGFADSTEFANKCASYGITVGNHVDVPTTVRGTAGSATPAATPVTSGSYAAQIADPNNQHAVASSPAELDAYWTSRGYEIYYITLEDGSTVKAYAQFADMTAHNARVNSWRAEQGLPALTPITDPNDPRFQFIRQRAVEVAYKASHTRPMGRERGWDAEAALPFAYGVENLTTFVEDGNLTAFNALANSEGHAATMRRNRTGEFATASCYVMFVTPDGLGICEGSPYNGIETARCHRGNCRATVQMFFGDDIYM